MFVCMYIYMYAYMYVYMCVYILYIQVLPGWGAVVEVKEGQALGKSTD